jgi:hypothetical protein
MTHPPVGLLAFQAFFAVVVVASISHAQPVDPPPAPHSPPPRERTSPPEADGPIAVPVSDALADLADAYRGVTAEEVTVRLRSPGVQGESVDRFVMRIETPIEAGRPITRLKLEFDTIHITLGGGRMVAESASGGSRVHERAYEGTITPELLGALFPPVTAVGLAIAGGASRDLADPTPFTPGVRWSGAEAVDDASGGRIVLRGASAASGESRLTVESRPIDPGDLEAWGIPTASRERVGSLAELRQGNGTGAMVGDRTQDLVLSGIGAQRWSMHAALRRARASGVEDPVAIVIVFRASVDEQEFLEAEREARAGLEALRRLIGTSSPLAARAITRSAVVIAPADWTPEWPGYLYERWGSGVIAGGVELDADQLFWSGSPSATIERYHAGRAFMLVVDAELMLRGVVTLVGSVADPVAIEAGLRAAFEASPPTREK